MNLNKYLKFTEAVKQDQRPSASNANPFSFSHTNKKKIRLAVRGSNPAARGVKELRAFHFHKPNKK